MFGLYRFSREVKEWSPTVYFIVLIVLIIFVCGFISGWSTHFGYVLLLK